MPLDSLGDVVNRHWLVHIGDDREDAGRRYSVLSAEELRWALALSPEDTVSTSAAEPGSTLMTSPRTPARCTPSTSGRRYTIST